MNKFAALFINDLKNTKRDPTLIVLMFLPILMLCFLRFGIPITEQYLPIIGNHKPLIIQLFGILTAAFPAFIVSFMMLDEKDYNVTIAIRVSPLSDAGYLLSRMFFLGVFGWLNAVMIFLFNGQVQLSITQSLILGFLSFLVSPSILLTTLLLAKNKIEGVTIMKIMNVSIMLPAISLFIDGSWRWAFGIFPAFWIYESGRILKNDLYFYFLATVGVIAACGINSILFWLKLKSSK